ncbi:hypothetical protein TH63_08190 [Rufibacter radiotolerans]|uniref:Ava_C0101 and related proteins n=1 Tax=Rufibacter radiotolerans TaxID=1379910 RepID=A0A0H4VIM0_9BACT|nr:DUF5996 family protein [Rufibacter radiotolerans]AKQ45635.1 hypothetical protein TH63_08190 [Rufibacter radiotolerans]
MPHTWPQLSYEKGHETYETLHLFTQIVGKIKLSKMPWTNHSWHVTLKVTPYGFTSEALQEKDFSFQLDFDFLQHLFLVKTSTGETHSFGLEGLSVAGFYQKVKDLLQELGIDCHIHTLPNELENPIPFEKDETHRTYLPEQAAALHQAFLKAQEVFTEFRAGFSGKCSPVHLFWGSFDLAVSRFSGKRAPKHPGGVPHLPDKVAQEAYSHEVYSCGFWPGNSSFPKAAFYSYIYPEPDGLADSAVKPAAAFFDKSLREFILPYQDVQQASNPTGVLMEFLNRTYEAAAELAHWDRKELEFDFHPGKG